MGRCKKVCPSWFEKEDGKGFTVKEWGKKHSESQMYCLVCLAVFSVQQKGFQAVTQHANIQKHIKECAAKLPPRQLRLAVVPPDLPCSSNQTVKLFDIQESSRRAELKWVMNCISHNYSANSCDGVGELFQDIFPCESSSGFKLSQTKYRYLLTDALGPYFREEINKDIYGSYFSLLFDETTNVASKKQLSTMVRYWSESQKQIAVHHLEIFFMGSATADQVFDKLNEAMSNADLPLNHLLMLGCDGPNVNKKVYRLMSEKVRLQCDHSLLSLGTCNLHVVHNTFAKGLEEFGEDVSDLVSSIHDFFDGWPLRKEEYEDVQKKMKVQLHDFIKHVPSRWLTLLGACERLLEQYPAVEEYFLKFVPKYRPKTLNSAKFKKIVKYLQDESCKAQIAFVISSAKSFQPFLRYFQKETPLIHNLYSQLNDLVFLLVDRVCKKENMPQSFEDLNVDTFFEVENLLPLKNVKCGETVNQELSSCHERTSLEFRSSVQKHFISACKYLVNHVKGKGATQLKDFRCLSHKKRFSKRSCSEIVKVAKYLPFKVDYDVLDNEWRLLQLTKTRFDLEAEKDPNKSIAIDKYWLDVLEIQGHDGSPKFQTVTKVVKAALALSHGNSDVERNFSISGNLMPEESSNMCQRTLNCMLTVRSYLKAYDYKPEHVFITKELLQLAKGAGLHYQAFLDEEKKKKEMEEEQKKKEREAELAAEELKQNVEDEKNLLDKKQLKIKEKKKEEDEDLKAAKKLFDEAHAKLKQAIEKESFEEVRVANALLEGASAIQKQAQQKRKIIDKETQLVDKKKSSLITAFLVKRPKK